MIGKQGQCPTSPESDREVARFSIGRRDAIGKAASGIAITQLLMALAIVSTASSVAHAQPDEGHSEQSPSEFAQLVSLTKQSKRADWYPATQALGRIAERDPVNRGQVWVAARVNTLGMRFVQIAPGEFTMGPDKHRIYEEDVAHPVRISRSFFIAVTEVTNEEMQQLSPSFKASAYSPDPDSPAVGVTWEQARRFCDTLSQKEDAVYRLPTEAEWEYACRAGTDTQWSFGRFRFGLADYGWCKRDIGRASRVAGLKPNAWGIYDMHGNVAEWVHDWFSNSYYLECEAKGLMVDPVGPPAGWTHVLRSGAWLADNPLACTSTARFPLPLLDRVPFSGEEVGFRQIVGFRVVRDIGHSEGPDDRP